MRSFLSKFPLGENHWFVKLMWMSFVISLPIARDINEGVQYVMLAFGLVFNSPRQLWNTLKERYFLLFLGSLYILQLIGMLYTDDKNSGWLFLSEQYFQILVPIICLLYSQHLKVNVIYYSKVFVWTVASASLVVLLFLWMPYHWSESLIESLTLVSRNTSDPFRFGMYVPFMNRIQFSNVVAVSVLIALFLTVNGEKKRTQGVLFIGLLAFSFVLGGRGATLALIGALLVFAYGLFSEKIKSKLEEQQRPLISKTIVWLSPVIILFSILLLSYQIPAINSRYKSVYKEYKLYQTGAIYQQPDHITKHQTVVRRLVSYENFWKAITSNNWLIGVGTGDIYVKSEQVFANDQIKIGNHFHTQYLQIWLGIGVIGLMAFLFLIAYCVKQVVRNKQVKWLALSMCFFYILCAIPDAILKKQTVSVLFPLVFSLMSFVPRIPENKG